MKFNPMNLKFRVLVLCLWLAVCPTAWELNQLHADDEDRVTRELNEEILPTLEIEELSEAIGEDEIGIYPGEYLADQLRVLGREKYEIVSRYIALLPSEMSAIFGGLDAKGGGLEILSLYMAMSFAFNIEAGKPGIHSDIAAVGSFKAATYDRYDFYKGIADKAARFLVGGWLYRKSQLTQKLGYCTKDFVQIWKDMDGLVTAMARYAAVKPFKITDDTVDLAVELFKKAGSGKTMKILKGVGDVMGFVDLAFSSYNFATNEEWTFLFQDGVMTFQQIKASVDLAAAILGLACFSMGPVAAVVMLLVSLIMIGIDLYASYLKEWGIKFIDCREVLAENDPSFSPLIGHIDEKGSGSFAQRVYTAIKSQRASIPESDYTDDAKKQFEGLEKAAASRYLICRHYNAYKLVDIDPTNLKVFADKWKTKADAQSDWWWWPQFNPFNTRHEAAEKQYFSEMYYGSQRIGDNDAKWCYMNYDFFLIKLFENVLHNFETSAADLEKIKNNPVVRLVQNRIQVAPFHYFPMLLNLMGFIDAGFNLDTVDNFIYLCTYSLDVDMAVTTIRESGYFLTYIKAMREQYSRFENGISQQQENHFGLKTENADYIAGAAVLKDIVFTRIDDPEKELTEEDYKKIKRLLNLKKPASDKMTYQGLVEKNRDRLNSILRLLPLKALSVSAKIVLLKVLLKQYYVRRAYLTACETRYGNILRQLSQPDPFTVEDIEGLAPAPPASQYPLGKEYLNGVVSVKDKEENGQLIEFDFSAGGSFWSPDKDLMLVFNNNISRIRDYMNMINQSLDYAQMALNVVPGHGSSRPLSLEQINRKCADIMRAMRQITVKIENSPATELEVAFSSDNAGIYLMLDKNAYPHFDVTDGEPPRVFTTQDLAYSIGRPGPTDPIVDTAVPDFYAWMLGEPPVRMGTTVIENR